MAATSSGYGKSHSREELPVRKFKVQMYDFACEDVAAQGRSELFLKLDFDNTKIYKTDTEVNTRSPEWGFKAGFQYVTPYLEKLRSRTFRISCYDKSWSVSTPVGVANIDLHTIACGPQSFKLTLREPGDGQGEPRGFVSFICVMKMISPNLRVIFESLQLTMQGCPAPAELQITSSLADEVVAKVPHSNDGSWPGQQFAMTFETTLGDLLKAPAYEHLRISVFDVDSVQQGEVKLDFRQFFSLKEEKIPFQAPVSYFVEGESVTGTVGELSGNMYYQNLPVYAQMVGGRCVDGQVEDSFWLYPDLPYPSSCEGVAPPLWQDPADRPTENDHPNDHHDGNDVPRSTMEALEKIMLPPNWDKRRDRTTGRPYFADQRSRKTTWKDPRFLPENWDQRIDPSSGKVYFAYHKTRQTTYTDPRGCPTGWEMRVSKDGHVYFAFRPAMQTTYSDPRGLPEGLEASLDDLGRTYFKNHEEKTTTWDDPRLNQVESVLQQWKIAETQAWINEQVWKEIEEMNKAHDEATGRENHDDAP